MCKREEGGRREGESKYGVCVRIECVYERDVGSKGGREGKRVKLKYVARQ